MFEGVGDAFGPIALLGQMLLHVFDDLGHALVAPLEFGERLVSLAPTPTYVGDRGPIVLTVLRRTQVLGRLGEQAVLPDFGKVEPGPGSRISAQLADHSRPP